MTPKYIVVRIGCLADGKGSGAYQVHQRCGDLPVYEPVLHGDFKNDPVDLRTAAQRLAVLVDKETT